MRQPTIHQIREKKKSSRKVEEVEKLQYIFFYYRVTETTNSAPMTESLFSPSKNTQTEQSIFQYAKEEEDQRRD
jgi:helix-turn-helix protein